MPYTDQTSEGDITQRFDAITSHIPGVLFRCHPTPGYPLMWVAGKSQETIGYTHDELMHSIGGAWSTILHPDDRIRMLTELQNALDAHEPWQIEFRMVSPVGKVVWVKGYGGGLYSTDGELQALEGVIIDMTAQMAEKSNWQSRAQEARERNVRIVAATADILETLQSLSVLSINASIEAARAGDAGRGFSVVAQEMNRLAARAEDTATAIRRATGSNDQPNPMQTGLSSIAPLREEPAA
ncbi:methyl-accepting chemotaxis sensory transducer with Pas/Pac sensor [Monaibacterium marinum]|uniref:Methyl-accepting chemotaxis sensory transducer with Pas/Pac sensor n=1 Tax=Pontivivens marinum TaxID=1690039 RepID=A0A2C9CQW2_9RHOB|nr:PAS domain-containing protein [Monaibacterium marinum]SOH93565.1 methyl-accepting chemotaxis sensory transducer with Pas/Pac sensor [Monaibacterium marinum]